MATVKEKLNELLSTVVEKFPEDRDRILKAYEYISEKHKGQKRKSGEPYIVHPLNVAKILADMNLDSTTVIAGLLHDVLEDTDATYEEIKELFGKEVADIVEGVTKIGKFKFRNLEEAQAENFRKLIIATAKDVRVIIVKLVDRLHNMRTLHYLPREKRIRIAKETLQIYAPIAHRLGMWEIKRELEDLAFKHLFPAEYEKVKNFVSQSLEDLEEYLKKFIIPKVKEELKKAGIEAQITYRPKHLYSIWQKTIRKNISLEEVHDILGVRVIVNTVQECYMVLGIIHNLFTPVPGRFKDYISLPKPNLYQSLHTTVIGPKGRLVEFQIRTKEMHERAEKGIASHWAYKEGINVKEKDMELFSWLRELVEHIQGMKNPSEVLDSLKRELFSEEVFVFTPKGDLVVLPEGATPVDFAYHIHTEIGNHCAGAKVNGRLVPLNYRLKNGDVVEIITNPNKKPSPDWLKFVVTSKAKNRIKHFLRQQEKKRLIEEGKKLFEKIKEAVKLSKEEIIEILKKRIRFKDEEELMVALGSGKVNPKFLIKVLTGREERIEKEKEEKVKGTVSIDGLSDVMYHIAECCLPVPGDEIYGVITKGKGIVLHEKNCANLKYLKEIFPEKVFKVNFNAKGKFKTKIRVVARDRIGVLSEITTKIAERKANIREAITKTYSEGTAVMDFIIDVENRKHLIDICNAIKEVEGIVSCSRLYS